MDASIEPKPERSVSFSVTDTEAASIDRWLTDALAARINTPSSSDKIYKIRDAFRHVAENK